MLRPLLFLLLFPPLPALATPVQTLLVLGDSLSSGHGIPVEQGWVALLQRRLQQDYPSLQVINGSVSGETSRGGASRVTALLRQYRPAVVLIELGGNDGLRGLPLDRLRDNLAQIIEKSQQQGALPLLIGVRIPDNYGPLYTQRFTELYAQLAQRYAIPLVPRLLAGLETQPQLFQEDGIHPRAAAQPLLLESVWKVLQPLLERVAVKVH